VPTLVAGDIDTVSVVDKWLKVRRHLQTDGFVPTMRWAVAAIFYYPVARWIDSRFDRRYGTETGISVDVAGFHVSPELRAHAVEYSASPDGVFVRFLKDQELEYPSYTFVDLGCGKGRALLLASLFPFKRAIGVELEPGIHAVCQANIEIFARTAKPPRKPEVVQMSAGDFRFPPGDIFLYLFNPFDGHVMEQVARNLRAAIEEAPRRVRIVYFHPNHDGPLLGLPNVKVLRTEHFRDRKSKDNLGRLKVYDVA